MEQSSKGMRDRPFNSVDRFCYPHKDSRDCFSHRKLEASTGKLAARVEQLEKAQQRVSHELLEWRMQVQLADEATYSAWISAASAEDEERSVTSGLKTLEADLDLLFTSDAAGVFVEVWGEIFLTASAKLEALRERQLDARLKLQICRRHCHLQNAVLEQARAALLRAEQRSRAVGEEINALRSELEPHRDSAAQS
ncbi:MAG TPA: hypothetical protein VNE82_02690 [Candidatus Binataceae bacterium]|nr:hypothetical protein [Candidatus Binataceae bacterium]